MDPQYLFVLLLQKHTEPYYVNFHATLYVVANRKNAQKNVEKIKN